jgi:hypothetical protein
VRGAAGRVAEARRHTTVRRSRAISRAKRLRSPRRQNLPCDDRHGENRLRIDRRVVRDRSGRGAGDGRRRVGNACVGKSCIGGDGSILPVGRSRVLRTRAVHGIVMDTAHATTHAPTHATLDAPRTFVARLRFLPMIPAIAPARPVAPRSMPRRGGYRPGRSGTRNGTSPNVGVPSIGARVTWPGAVCGSRRSGA